MARKVEKKKAVAVKYRPKIDDAPKVIAKGQGKVAEKIIEIARENGAAKDPVMRQRLADAWMGLEIMRGHALRMLSHAERPELSPEAMITKLYWASWHRDLGKLAMDVLGPESQLLAEAPYVPTALQRLFLFTRSDTIYAGSNQIQRNLIAQRALGLPREPR